MLRSSFAALAAALPLATALSSPAVAQAAQAANKSVYDRSFIERYNVNTAEDILRRIPGVLAILDANTGQQQERGFGSGGSQILLNGRRFPGKTNEINTTLRRIPAASVDRVELISGAADGISVQSEGIIVNLVLRADASVSGSGAWELNGRFSERGVVGVDGLLSYSRAFGGTTVSGGAEHNVWAPPSSNAGRWSRRSRDEAYYFPGGAVMELRPQQWSRSTNKWILTGSVEHETSGGATANLNALIELNNYWEDAVIDFSRFRADGSAGLVGTEHSRRQIDHNNTVEIGGEYRTKYGPGQFTGLFIVRREENPTLNFRNREEPTRSVEVSRSLSRTNTGEDILRLSYLLPLGGPSLEFGGEGARNTLRQHLDAFYDFNGDGRLEPARVPIANPEVKELRGEGFANLKWQATSALSFDGSMNYEFSRLTTNYPLQPVRELGFLKPRLDTRYRPAQGRQYRLLVERKVSQLDFANFVPSYNVVDDRVEAGNPNLQPEKTWTFELGYERRLPMDGGVLELRGFYDKITDAIDKVPLIDDRGVVVSASGNIDHAERYGLEAKASVRLTFIGLKDAMLSLRGLRQWSEVEDPFTHQERRLRGDRTYAYDVSYRHDLQAWRAAYGFAYKSTGQADTLSDLLVTEHYTIDPTLEAFVEHALTKSVTLRVEAQNLTNSPERRWRVQYAVNAIDGTPRRLDFYEERRDRRLLVRLRGRF